MAMNRRNFLCGVAAIVGYGAPVTKVFYGPNHAGLQAITRKAFIPRDEVYQPTKFMRELLLQSEQRSVI